VAPAQRIGLGLAPERSERIGIGERGIDPPGMIGRQQPLMDIERGLRAGEPAAVSPDPGSPEIAVMVRQVPTRRRCRRATP
jgi:hypothetical protein